VNLLAVDDDGQGDAITNGPAHQRGGLWKCLDKPSEYVGTDYYISVVTS
jgi:hypothetical protein